MREGTEKEGTEVKMGKNLETIYEVSRDDCYEVPELGSSNLLFPVLKYSPSNISRLKNSEHPPRQSEIN